MDERSEIQGVSRDERLRVGSWSREEFGDVVGGCGIAGGARPPIGCCGYAVLGRVGGWSCSARTGAITASLFAGEPDEEAFPEALYDFRLEVRFGLAEEEDGGTGGCPGASESRCTS